MKGLLLVIVYLFVGFTNETTSYYSAKYKMISNLSKELKIDSKSQIGDYFLGGLVYNFVSTSKVCFLKTTESLNNDGIVSNVSGDENIFINYQNGVVSYKLDNQENFKYDKVTFKKTQIEKKILGFKAIKYVSEDNNIAVYVTEELPWYIQPCIFNTKQFNGSIIRFENKKANYGFELIEYIKEDKTNKEDNTINKVLNLKESKDLRIKKCPFFES